jgi:hypothetical protein
MFCSIGAATAGALALSNAAATTPPRLANFLPPIMQSVML